jgi:hypothetical protein
MCWYCGAAIKDAEPIGRSLTCEDCGKDLRSCRNCSFYLPKSSGSCAESNAEPQSERERGNFCDWYKLNPVFRSVTQGETSAQHKADNARKAFEDLFS